MDAGQVLVGGGGDLRRPGGLPLGTGGRQDRPPPWLRHCFRDTLANLKAEPGEVTDYFEKNM